MLDLEKQRDHYDRLMAERRPNQGLSCGFDSRFDPFLLDKRPELRKEFDDLFESAYPDSVGSMLDIGCGSGLYFPSIAGKAEKIVGVDISSEMIKAAQHLVDRKGYKNFELMVGNVQKLHFPDESFESVLGFDVLHHVPDVNKSLLEIRRILKPGGTFVSIEPNVLNPMVWLAHALPPEERGALRHNYPWAINGLIRRHIGRPKAQYVNHTTAPNGRFIRGLVRIISVMTKFWPLKYFSIRMLITAEKQ